MRPRTNRKLRILKQNVQSSTLLLMGSVVVIVLFYFITVFFQGTLLTQSVSLYAMSGVAIAGLGLAAFMTYRIYTSFDKVDEGPAEKQIKEKLTPVESKYQALIQHSLDLICIVSREGKVSYMSPSAERMLGYKPDDLIGQPIYEIMHAEDHSLLQNSIDTKTHNFIISFRFQHRDGTGLYFEASGTNMLDNPLITGYILTARDVTDRKREEEQTKQKEMAALRFNFEKEKAETEKKIIEEKNAELSAAYSTIKHQNEEIHDSITYAFRIQSAIVPDPEDIRKVLPQSFVFWRPKDIVSGDFYWFAHKEEKGLTLIAAADCTGHGVPGAFMTMIGNTILNQIVLQLGHDMPDQILNNLHLGVRRSLRQDQAGSQSRDGMDITFACIDHRNRKLHFAAANNPLVFVHNGEGSEYKADKYPIGGLQTEDQRIFTLNTIDYEPGDYFFIFSDGFQDQFGGDKGRKYMTKRFKELLVNIHTLEPAAQRDKLESEIVEWMGTRFEQIDDILVIGVRL
jgi:PAS domain S-box-containing protein